MPAGSICGSRVRYAGYGRRLTCAVRNVPGYYNQCRSVTTSTIVKRRWHVLRMLSGAILSTWALALALYTKWLWPRYRVWAPLIFSGLVVQNHVPASPGNAFIQVPLLVVLATYTNLTWRSFSMVPPCGRLYLLTFDSAKAFQLLCDI